MYFCTSVYFKTSEKKTPTDKQTIFLKKYFQIYEQADKAVTKFAPNFGLA